MKVTFLIPPVLDGTHNVDRCFGCNYGIYFLPLLPVLYSATLLKNVADAVSIEDFAARRKKASDFKDFIRNDESDIYIFYTVFLSQNTDLLARKFIREVKPGALFIFSGPQATFSPEVFLDRSDTFVIRGEPEFIIRELIQRLKTGADLKENKGISYRKGSEVIHNFASSYILDIDQVPIPDRSLLDHTAYFNPKLHNLPHTAALTSRGCFGQCWYCVPNSLSYARELEYKKQYGIKPPPRLHSIERVKEEFRNIKESGFKSVSIIDDEFIWDEERTVKICDCLSELKLEWSCLSRPDTISENVAKAMAKAGCAYVDLGTESFDQEILNAIKKNALVEDTKKAVRILKKYGVKPEINVLLGATSLETEETIKKTLREVRKLDVDYVLFSIANPFPGTDFYEAAKKNGWLVYGEYRPADPARESIISYPHLSKKKLEYYVSYAYFSHYFNLRYIIKQLFSTKSCRDFKNKFFTAARLIRRNFLKKA